MRPEVMFELRWSARIPLARPGGAGHDGKTSWYGSNHNDVYAGSLRSQQSTQKPALRNSIARCVQQAKHASFFRLSGGSCEMEMWTLPSGVREGTHRAGLAKAAPEEDM